MNQHIRRFPNHVLFLNQRIILLMNVLFLIIQCHHYQSYLDTRTLNFIVCHRKILHAVLFQTRVYRGCIALYTYSWKPSEVPPRCIPAHYGTEVCQQIQTMLDEGVIRHSKSPWMAPAVFVPKKSGQLRLCIDYQELNISVPLKTPTPYLSLMRYKTGLQGQQCSQHSTYLVGIGSCLLMLQTGKRLLFAQGQVWGSTSSAKCHLDCQVLLVHSSA